MSLILSSQRGDLNAVKVFLTSADKKEIDEALVWASYNKHIEIMKLLVAHGADVQYKDGLALRWSADRTDNLEVINYLKKMMLLDKLKTLVK
jgi:ankyrin repeat protein